MRTFVLERPGQATLIDNAPYPSLEESYDVVLEPVIVAPCSSGVNTVYGSSSKKPGNPTLGCECIARIKAVASRMRDFRVGDLIVVPAITPDWRNAEVQEGNDRHAGRPLSGSALGWSIPGVSAEAFDITDADTTLAKLPEGVRLEDTLMCVDMVTTGSTGVEAAELKLDDAIVVLGISTAGLMAVRGAALRGAARIYMVDTREVSVRRAPEFSTAEALSYKGGGIREQIMARTDGRDVDAVFVCGGDDNTFRETVDMVRCSVGCIVNLKYYPGDGGIRIPRSSGGRGTTGETVHLGFCRGGKTRMERLLRLAKARRVEPRRMITHKFEGFPALAEGFEPMRQKPQDLIKVMVRLPPEGEEQQA